MSEPKKPAKRRDKLKIELPFEDAIRAALETPLPPKHKEKRRPKRTS